MLFENSYLDLTIYGVFYMKDFLSKGSVFICLLGLCSFNSVLSVNSSEFIYIKDISNNVNKNGVDGATFYLDLNSEKETKETNASLNLKNPVKEEKTDVKDEDLLIKEKEALEDSEARKIEINLKKCNDAEGYENIKNTYTKMKFKFHTSKGEKSFKERWRQTIKTLKKKLAIFSAVALCTIITCSSARKPFLFKKFTV